MNSEGCKCIKQVDSFRAVSISAVVYTLENMNIFCRKCLPASMQFALVLEMSTLLLFYPVCTCAAWVECLVCLSVCLYLHHFLGGLHTQGVFKGSLCSK